MKILYSAFECNPLRGSDAYVGWSWAKQAAKNNEVHILTSDHNREDIESYKKTEDIGGVFHYIGLPKLLKKLLKGRKGYFLGYLLWQRYAYRYAKKLNKEIGFDVSHHISIADFRVIGYLWKLNIPFVFGPVGGGQETPAALEDYVRSYRKQERIRSMLNALALLRPSYRRGIRRAAAVFVSNDETIDAIRKRLGGNIRLTQMCELGVDAVELKKRASLTHETKETVHIIVSGRMMYRKGLELLMDACLRVETSIPWVVDVYGGGHQEADVRRQIRERGLESKMYLHGKVPYAQMLQAYANADIFALPSLRETTGTAVIEAMSNKLPVVALNQNGVRHLVADRAGVLADIGTKEETVQNLAEALKQLIEDQALRQRLGEQGYQLLQAEHTWQVKVSRMEEIYNTIRQNNEM